jgi:hypothetical protein
LCKNPTWKPVYENLQEVTDKCDIAHKENNTKTRSNQCINVILEDTYPVFDKIPEKLKVNDYVRIQRENIGNGVRTKNQCFINDSVREIDKIYKLSYERMNIFASTNPENTCEIVKNAFCMDTRERPIDVYVYQSCGDTHEYLKSVKI